MKGIIYCAQCLITSKYYIGQTLRPFQSRIAQHKSESFNPNCVGYNYHFHRAIRKYGFDSFVWKIISTIQCDTREELEKQLNHIEKFYIRQYNSYYQGYNSTSGGEQSSKIANEISVYNEDGILLGIYSSAQEVSQIYGISTPVIYQICNRNSLFTVKAHKKYIFRWRNDSYTESEISQVKAISIENSISMYSIDGILLETFASTSEAVQKLSLTRNRIITCYTKHSAFVQLKDSSRVIFRKGNDICTKEDCIKAASIKSDPKKYVKAINSRTGQIIGVFKTMTDGGKYFKTQPGKISECCSGKRKSSGKTPEGDKILWKYSNQEEYDKYVR